MVKVKQKEIDKELSKYFTDRIFKIRENVNPKDCEDLLLLNKWVRPLEPPYWQEGGVLRLSPEGIFIYGTSDGKRISTGFATSKITVSPFLNSIYSASLPKSEVGIKIETKNPATGNGDYDIDMSIRLLKSGILHMPESKEFWSNLSGKLFTEFIANYTPSCGGFPGCDRWSKLIDTQKKKVIGTLIERVDRAFSLKEPEVYHRVKYIH